MQEELLYPRFSNEEFARRYANVRAAMQQAGLDVLVLYGSIDAHSEVLYLSNFPVTREAMLVFPLAGDPTLFLQMYNHVPNARQVACLSDVRWGGLDTAVTVAAYLREQGMAEQRLGFVGTLPLRHYETLRRGLPATALHNFTQEMMQLRLIKSEEEIAFLRKGAELSDRAIEALEREVRPGLRERELVAIVEGAYLGLGGKNHIHYMATTPMHNPSVCVPAQHHSTRIIEKGDVLITEISASYFGYAGQILRPFAIGTSPTRPYQQMYDVAVETFQRIAAIVRAGASTDEVLDAAEYIHAQGFTIYDDLLHGFGGGYLPPILRTRLISARPSTSFTFQENMVIVIQPNIITPDERMGVQVGEMLRVTRDSVESLHRYPMRFIQCGMDMSF